MSKEVPNQDSLDFTVAERPITVTLHLSPADVELALMSGGASLCPRALRALVLARVFDVDKFEVEAPGDQDCKLAA